MLPHTTSAHGRDTVVIVGGKGGLFARYREAVERNGYQFLGYEDHVPAKSGPCGAKIALVIVIVTMVSHPLMARARALAGDQERIVYLKSPSLTAVRQTVEAVAKRPALRQHQEAA